MVPSEFRMIGPYCSKRIVSPSLMVGIDGSLSLLGGGRSLGVMSGSAAPTAAAAVLPAQEVRSAANNESAPVLIQMIKNTTETPKRARGRIKDRCRQEYVVEESIWNICEGIVSSMLVQSLQSTTANAEFPRAVFQMTYNFVYVVRRINILFL